MWLKKKSEAFSSFKTYKSWAENQLGLRIKAIQDDKGGEFMSKEFQDYLASNGMVARHSTLNRPQQNGVAERANMTMSEHCTAMLSEANIPPSFLPDAVNSYLRVWNMCPCSSTPSSTPYMRCFPPVQSGHLSCCHSKRQET